MSKSTIINQDKLSSLHLDLEQRRRQNHTKAIKSKALHGFAHEDSELREGQREGFNQQIVIRYTSEVTLPRGYKCLTVKTVSVRLRSSPQVPSIQEWNIQFGHVQIHA